MNVWVGGRGRGRTGGGRCRVGEGVESLSGRDHNPITRWWEVTDSRSRSNHAVPKVVRLGSRVRLSFKGTVPRDIRSLGFFVNWNCVDPLSKRLKYAWFVVPILLSYLSFWKGHQGTPWGVNTWYLTYLHRPLKRQCHKNKCRFLILVGRLSSSEVSQLCMLRISGSIPAAHTIIRTGGSVL